MTRGRGGAHRLRHPRRRPGGAGGAGRHERDDGERGYERGQRGQELPQTTSGHAISSCGSRTGTGAINAATVVAAMGLEPVPSSGCRRAPHPGAWSSLRRDQRVGPNQDHTHPLARGGRARRRKGQAAALRSPQGPASDLRRTDPVARAPAGARREAREDRDRGRPRRRRRPGGRAVLGPLARAGVRRADRAARDRARGARGAPRRRPRRRRPGRERRLRSDPAGRRAPHPPAAPADRRGSDDRLGRAGRSRRVRPRGPRRTTGARGRRVRRCVARGPAAHRGGDELGRVPPRRAVPGAPEARPEQPAARVLPEPRLPDVRGQRRAPGGRCRATRAARSD